MMRPRDRTSVWLSLFGCPPVPDVETKRGERAPQEVGVPADGNSFPLWGRGVMKMSWRIR